jgi:hypothetical protein
MKAVIDGRGVMQSPVKTLLLAASGVLLAFATFTYASVAVPHLTEDLVEISVRPTLLRAVVQAMRLGIVTLAAITGGVAVEAVRSYRGVAVSRANLAILGGAFVILGLLVFQATHSPHALGYSLIGALLIGAMLTK